MRRGSWDTREALGEELWDAPRETRAALGVGRHPASAVAEELAGRTPLVARDCLLDRVQGLHCKYAELLDCALILLDCGFDFQILEGLKCKMTATYR